MADLQLFAALAMLGTGAQYGDEFQIGIDKCVIKKYI